MVPREGRALAHDPSRVPELQYERLEPSADSSLTCLGGNNVVESLAKKRVNFDQRCCERFGTRHRFAKRSAYLCQSSLKFLRVSSHARPVESKEVGVEDLLASTRVIQPGCRRTLEVP